MVGAAGKASGTRRVPRKFLAAGMGECTGNLPAMGTDRPAELRERPQSFQHRARLMLNPVGGNLGRVPRRAWPRRMERSAPDAASVNKALH